MWVGFSFNKTQKYFVAGGVLAGIGVSRYFKKGVIATIGFALIGAIGGAVISN